MRAWGWTTVALLTAGCEGGGTGPSADAVIDEASVVATFSEAVITVATVELSTWADATVHVEYGLDTGYGEVTPETPAGTAHELVLLGLKPETTWHYRVVATVDGDVVAGDDHTLVVGKLPDGVPTFVVLEEGPGERWGRYSLVSYQLIDGQHAGVVVLDDDADVVWYWRIGGNQSVWTEVDDAGTVQMFAMHVEGDVPEQFVEVPLATLTETITAAPNGHHAVAPDVPDAQFAYIAEDERTYQDETVVGDAIVEVLEDGSTREVWNAWDTLVVEHHEGWDGIYQPDGKKDWTHANGLDYVPGEDAYYLSLYYLETVLKIDRATGDILWTLGGSHNDFTWTEGEPFGHVHAPERLPGGLAYFDNGADPSSAFVVTSIDEDARTIAQELVWTLPDERSVTVQGEIDVLPDGSFFAAWGDAHRVTLVGADGTLQLEHACEELGTVLGQGQRLESLYY